MRGVEVMVNSMPKPELRDTSDIRGRFSFAKVPVGLHTLTFTYGGYTEQTLSNIEVTSGKEVIMLVELEEVGFATEAEMNQRDNTIPKMYLSKPSSDVVSDMYRSLPSPLGDENLLQSQPLGSENELRRDSAATEDDNPGYGFPPVAISGFRDIDKAKPLNQMSLISARQFTVDDTRRFAGARNDIARMASNFSGVVGSQTYRNDMIIRGNNPMGMLWRLEGIDIPNPNHMGSFDATGGTDCIISNNVLGNSDFVLAPISAEYGNAYAGVFDMSLRSGNDSKHEFLAQASNTFTEFNAEGPLSRARGSSYVADVRVGYDMLRYALPYLNPPPIPFSGDAAFKLNFPSAKVGTISIFGVGGASNYRAFQQDSDYPVYNLDYNIGTRTGIVGMKHRRLWGTKTISEIVAAATYRGDYTQYDYALREGETPVKNFTNGNVYTKNFGETRYSVRGVVTHKFTSRANLQVGGTWNQYVSSFVDSTYQLDSLKWDVLRNDSGSGMLLQGFIQSKVEPIKNVFVVGGFYGQYLALNNTSVIEPRLSSQWQMHPRHTVSLGYSRNSQMQPFSVYLQRLNAETVRKYANLYQGVDTRSNLNLKFMQNEQIVASYDFIATPTLHFHLEAYAQHMRNAPINGRRNTGAIPGEFTTFYLLNYGGYEFSLPVADSLQNGGEGRNIGLEFTAEKFFSKNYYFLVTASVFDAKMKAQDGVWRNTAFNTNYMINAVSGVEVRGFSNNDRFAFDLRAVSAGGWRYTPIDKHFTNKVVLDYSKTNTEQFEPYVKIDFRVSYRQNFKKHSQVFMLFLENIGRAKIELRKDYYKDGTSEIIYREGARPMLQYKIEF